MPIRLLILCFLTAVASASVWGQPADLPTPEALFERAHTALGWAVVTEEDIGHIEAHAHVEVEGRTYDTIVSSKVGNPVTGNARFTMIGEDGTVTYGDTDGTIWFEGEDGERRTLSPAMAAFVHGHQFHRRVLFPRNEFKTIDAEVREDYFAGQRVFVVSGTTPAGATLQYFFSQQEGRIVGFHLTVQEEGGPHPMDFTLKDWRAATGQYLFWRVDINDRGKIYVYRFDRILMLP